MQLRKLTRNFTFLNDIKLNIAVGDASLKLQWQSGTNSGSFSIKNNMLTTENKPVRLIADVLLIHKDSVLLCKYKDLNKYDHQKGWFLPDDLVKFNEHPSDAARRILNEQMSYITANLALGFIESFIGNDGSWHLIFHYWQKVDALPEIMPTGEISEYNWFDRFALPEESEIAHHGWAKYTIEKIYSNMR